MAKDWREDLDPLLQEHLENLLKETAIHKGAFCNAKNITQAQMWTALSILIKQNFDLKLRVDVLERALQDMGPKKKKPKKSNVDPAKELKDVLKKL